MAKASSASQTPYSDLDWSHYTKHRPAYPPSLRDLIYKYRTKHDRADWDLLVDIGGGIGVSSIPFAADFQTLHLLDPSALNHKQARVFLEQHVASHNLLTKLDFTVARAEDAKVKDASMAICASAAHFVDPNALVRSIAAMLRPSGTMAIYTYWFPVFPGKSAELDNVFAKAMITAMRMCLSPGDDVTYTAFVGAASRLCAGPRILDSIAVPEELFDDVRRVRINPAAESTLEVYRADPPVFGEPLPVIIGPHEQEFIYTTGEHPEAKGWMFDVDLAWLHGMIKTVVPSGAQLGPEQKEKLYGQLDRLFTAECPSGSTRALFPVNMILATRK